MATIRNGQIVSTINNLRALLSDVKVDIHEALKYARVIADLTDAANDVITVEKSIFGDAQTISAEDNPEGFARHQELLNTDCAVVIPTLSEDDIAQIGGQADPLVLASLIGLGIIERNSEE